MHRAAAPVTIGFVLALILGAASHAQSPTVGELAKRVDTHYNHLQSLQARFTERYRGMGLDRSESGTLTLRKPGRMRWAYDAPAGKLFVLDGKNGYSYTPGDVQALRTPAKQLNDLRSPLRFLLGHTELAKELDGLAITVVEGGYTLAGTPKGMQQSVRTIALMVDSSGQIRSMRVEQVDGSLTSFDFTAIQENLPTKDSDFTFAPPEGVTVIEGAAPI